MARSLRRNYAFRWIPDEQSNFMPIPAIYTGFSTDPVAKLKHCKEGPDARNRTDTDAEQISCLEHPNLNRRRPPVRESGTTSGLLALIRNPDRAGSVTIPANLVPLIKRTFRYTYMLATRMRDDMIDDGNREKLDELINEARELENSLRRGVNE